MSRRKRDISTCKDFADRFQEICETSQPAQIQRAFGISYQAAKNYLNGRYPETDVLLNIARVTGVSLHWLLTGEGPRKSTNETNPFYWIEKKNLGEMEVYIRSIFREELKKYFPEKFSDEESSLINRVSDQVDATDDDVASTEGETQVITLEDIIFLDGVSPELKLAISNAISNKQLIISKQFTLEKNYSVKQETFKDLPEIKIPTQAVVKISEDNIYQEKQIKKVEKIKSSKK
jgi:transcriptional regulator with XRE-family HTH domain